MVVVYPKDQHCREGLGLAVTGPEPAWMIERPLIAETQELQALLQNFSRT